MNRIAAARRVFSAIAYIFALIPFRSAAVNLYDEFPDTVRASEGYVIYSHGLIVEGDDPTPHHPSFGLYDFPAIKRALFAGGDFNLIAPHRPKNTDSAAYVTMLDSWVQRLVEKGVKPNRITLVGFSRGGQLTAHAAARGRSLGINTVLLGACQNGDIAHDPPLSLGGHVLSIYESSDDFGSCWRIAARGSIASFDEIALSTGRRHGAFFQPMPEWIRPFKEWVKEKQ